MTHSSDVLGGVINSILVSLMDATLAVSYVAAITAQDKGEEAGPTATTHHAVDMSPAMCMRSSRRLR
jgi:hypothetical protein